MGFPCLGGGHSGALEERSTDTENTGKQHPSSLSFVYQSHIVQDLCNCLQIKRETVDPFMPSAIMVSHVCAFISACFPSRDSDVLNNLRSGKNN